MPQSTEGSADLISEDVVTVEKLQEQLNAAIAERDTLKTQHRDFKTASKNVSEVQKQYEELLTKHSALETEYTTFKTSQVQKTTDAHLQTALEASGAHNAMRVKAMLDLSALKIADDGTPDQPAVAAAIKALKTSDPYLFKPEGDEGNVESSGSTTKSLPVQVKRAADTQSTDAYKLALAEARKAKDPYKAIEDVIKRFGK